MRRGFGLIGLVVTAILLTIVGVIAYNIGWSDGVATHLPAGTAVRFEPGEIKEVRLVALGGERVVYGLNGLVNGKLK